MTKDKMFLIRYIYKILLSTTIISAGISLIVGCVSIYFSGNGYSRDIVANTFSKFNVPIFISLALIIGDIIWELIIPTTAKSKANNKKSNTELTSSATEKVSITKFIILGIAIISLCVGAIMGGFNDVLTKAVNICTECIGLG